MRLHHISVYCLLYNCSLLSEGSLAVLTNHHLDSKQFKVLMYSVITEVFLFSVLHPSLAVGKAVHDSTVHSEGKGL